MPIFGGIVGIVIAVCTMNTAARYVSLWVSRLTIPDSCSSLHITPYSFLMAQSYAGFVVLYTWVSNSFLRLPSRHAGVVALVNAFSQLSDVAGSCVSSCFHVVFVAQVSHKVVWPSA